MYVRMHGSQRNKDKREERRKKKKIGMLYNGADNMFLFCID
jgi:hypothetical protein